MPTYRKPVPLVLFHKVNVGIQTDGKQVFNAKCDTSDLKRFIDSICQTESLKTSCKEIQASNIDVVDKFCQIRIDVADSVVQTDPDQKDRSVPFIFPTVLKPLQRYQLTTSMFVQPKGFSPMATLLTPMGNAFFLLFLQAQNLRKKASRIEDDNESLVLQLKKMATKARSMNYIYI